VRLSQDGIPAKPNARYLFRCWVKADCRFLLIVYAFRPDGNYDTFVIAEGNGTQGNQWQLFGGVVRTPPDASRFKVSLVTDSRGEAWFDETELIPLERPPYAFVPITDTAPKLDGDSSPSVATNRTRKGCAFGHLKVANPPSPMIAWKFTLTQRIATMVFGNLSSRRRATDGRSK
jgi:hypothetical protein